MKNEVVIGIDTSNYTTSLAILSLDGELIANIKIPLNVKDGERGLRQSDAVFAHTKNLPIAIEEAKKYLADKSILAIGVSEKPRNQEGSYMPCFLSGIVAAESMSAALNVPLYRFSHQCGHIMAALYSSGRIDLLSREFCAFHVSGGTTEMLRVKASGAAFKAELIGGTADLNAGQVIDRIGVHMGLSFPAGKELEALALSFTEKIKSKKPSVSGFKINLSGLENMAMSLYKESGDPARVAAFVFDYIGKSLLLLATEYEKQFGSTEFVFAGGVMSNSLIKDFLKSNCRASFAEPALSADNAVGIAMLALRSYLEECK